MIASQPGGDGSVIVPSISCCTSAGRLTGAQGAPIVLVNMTRSAATILCLLVLQVLPALCAAGVLAHPCIRGGTTDCEPDAAGHDEANCAEDPCGALVTRPERESPRLAALAKAPAALADSRSRATACCTLNYPNGWAESPPCGHLPYPPSDLPLLL